MQVIGKAVCLVLLMAFLPPLLAFSSWIRLDCIARTSSGLQTLLEEECLCSWIHLLQMGDAPLLFLAWGYTESTKGRAELPLLVSYDSSFRKSHFTRFALVNYLDLRGSRAPSFFLHSFRLFSWFLDEGEWFIHDWCVVHMSGQGAGGAGCWTPGGCGALRPVKHCRRCLLSHFTAAPA